MMDEEEMEDIYDYLKEWVSDKIDDGMDEVGEEYREEEIGVVGMKLICEMGN